MCETKLTHRPATIRAAQEFVNRHHRHNAPPRGARFAVEAMWNGRVVGVVIVGRTIARALHSPYACEVLRCCVQDGAPRNTPSYLYGVARRVWQAWGGSTVITYTLDSEPGDSLRGAGFLPVAHTKARPKGWSSKGRPRAVTALDGVSKIRWELNSTAGQ